MDVFIASSTEGKDDLKAVTGLLKKAGLKPRAWTAPDSFKVGDNVFGSLLKLAEQVQGAAFIFRGDDAVKRGGLKNRALGSESKTRDNVILEYGLFAGILGPENCAVFIVRGTKPPSDLFGMNCISIDDVARAQAQTKVWALSLKEHAQEKWSQNMTPEQMESVARALKQAGLVRAAIYEIMRRLDVSPLAVDAALDSFS